MCHWWELPKSIPVAGAPAAHRLWPRHSLLVHQVPFFHGFSSRISQEKRDCSQSTGYSSVGKMEPTKMFPSSQHIIIYNTGHAGCAGIMISHPVKALNFLHTSFSLVAWIDGAMMRIPSMLFVINLFNILLQKTNICYLAFPDSNSGMFLK